MNETERCVTKVIEIRGHDTSHHPYIHFDWSILPCDIMNIYEIETKIYWPKSGIVF